jgi:hypothetical protein
VEGVSFKDWVRAKVVVGADQVQVFLNDRKILESDLLDLMLQQDGAGKEPYSNRIHKGIGIGLWNQSSGGSAVTVEFRNFRAGP